MSAIHEARFFEPLPDGRVLGTLCPHDCRIPDGGRLPVRTMGLYLSRWGFTPQKPIRRAYE